MQIVTTSNLFIIDSLSSINLGQASKMPVRAGFYQQITSELTKALCERRALVESSERLVRIADNALSLSRTDVAEQVSQILTSASLPREYKDIGEYYQALCAKRRGEYDAARFTLERLAESPKTPFRYRARALQAIGAIYYERRSVNEALRFYIEAFRAASRCRWDLLTLTLAQWMIAVIKSIKGDHKGALTDIESLSLLVRQVATEYPFVFYSYTNSLAVELGEVGRLQEALNASQIALASPYAVAYPEWRETGDELGIKARHRSRSTVAFSQRLDEQCISKPNNLLCLPVADHGEESAELSIARSQGKARIIDFQRWIMNRESRDTKNNKLTRQKIRQMTTTEKRLRIVDLISDDDIDERTLTTLLEFLESIAPDTKDLS